ncbi:MAG: SGNH/GDSL hydrolase family protein [Thermoleophilia bacterium]|nr:SGNH/GDSL hydrolase family protein [Thermoleophilia bacterium]
MERPATRPTDGIRYVAIGDSFSEGVGDELPDGTVRGWTDLFAQGWADALGEPIEYANLAIRGKLIEGIVEEQLEAALALEPTHLSLNGGGNDMLRPRADLDRIIALAEHVVDRCRDTGVELLLLSGGNPCRHLPLGRRIEHRGDQLAYRLEDEMQHHPGVVVSQNWFDQTLATARFWTQDRLHMNTRGHHRVAARLLERIGLDARQDWWDFDFDDSEPRLRGVAYYRTHVGPWIKRRLTGASSGDGMTAKHPSWIEVAPSGAGIRVGLA